MVERTPKERAQDQIIRDLENSKVNIFDDISQLQKLCKQEKDMVLTFGRLYNEKLGHLCNPEPMCAICEKDANQVDSANLLQQADGKKYEGAELTSRREAIFAGLVEAYQSKNKDSITGLIKAQQKAQLKYLSDLELFGYLVKKESIELDIKNIQDKAQSTGQALSKLESEQILEFQKQIGRIQKPKKRILVNGESQFNAKAGSICYNYFLSLFDYLYTNQYGVFERFTDVYLPKKLEECLNKSDITRTEEILESVISFAFIEPTSQVQDWRVVEISQRLIAREVKKASNIQQLMDSKLLMAWFNQLTKSNEAIRFIHYVFQAKCEKIDVNYLTWHNLHKVYQKYWDYAQTGKNDTDMRQSLYIPNPADNIRGSESSHLSSNEIEQQMNKVRQQRELFKVLIDIADVIMNQIFEKIATIPYTIRQFCKCIYQESVNKWPQIEKESQFGKFHIVAFYLMESWMLKAVFQDLNVVGLVKEFYLSHYCKKNLSLASLIVSKTMRFEPWEVATPPSEFIPGEEKTNLFMMANDQLRRSLLENTKSFYKDLLQLDAVTNKSVHSLSQDLDHVSESKSVFQWKVLLLSMKEINFIKQFFIDEFGENSPAKIPAVVKLLNNIEYSDEQSQVLTETPLTIKERQQIKLTDKDTMEGVSESDFAPTKYYLFVKPAKNPLEKEENKKKDKNANQIEGEVLTAKDLQRRTFLQSYLLDSGCMSQFRMLVKDQNSITNILAILRHHILLAYLKKDEGIGRKKVFGSLSNPQFFKYNFVNYSFTSHFNTFKLAARQEFQKFIKQQARAQELVNFQLKETLMNDFDAVCLQEKLLRERINITNTLVSIVANLRKTKSRSKFIYHSSLKVIIYQFEPNHYIEFLEEGQKSNYAKLYEEYKQLKAMEKEKSKAKAILNDRMKQPLQGNLALGFLFKDQDLNEIIRLKSSNQPLTPAQQKMYDQGMEESRLNAQQFSPDQAALMSKDPANIPGFHRSKIKYGVGNVNDFINKLRRASVLHLYFEQESLDYETMEVSDIGGVRKLIVDFRNKVHSQLKLDKLLWNDSEAHLDEIHEYVLFQLHQEFFKFQKTTQVKELDYKVAQIFNLPPSVYGNLFDEKDDEMAFAMKAAIKELQKIPEMQTPKQKISQVKKAQTVIVQAFGLYRSGSEAEVNADTLNQLLPYLFVRAKIPFLQAHLNFCYAFHICANKGSKSYNSLTQFGAAIILILNFKIMGDPQKALSQPKEEKEDQFEMKVSVTSPTFRISEQSKHSLAHMSGNAHISMGGSDLLTADDQSDQDDYMDKLLGQADSHQQQRFTKYSK